MCIKVISFAFKLKEISYKFLHKVHTKTTKEKMNCYRVEHMNAAVTGESEIYVMSCVRRVNIAEVR